MTKIKKELTEGSICYFINSTPCEIKEEQNKAKTLL